MSRILSICSVANPSVGSSRITMSFVLIFESIELRTLFRESRYARAIAVRSPPDRNA